MKAFLYLSSLILLVPSQIVIGASLDSDITVNSQSTDDSQLIFSNRSFCRKYKPSCRRYCQSKKYSKSRSQCSSCYNYSCKCYGKKRGSGKDKDKDDGDDRGDEMDDVSKEIYGMLRKECKSSKRPDREGDLIELELEESEIENDGKCRRLYARCMRKRYEGLQEPSDDDESEGEGDTEEMPGEGLEDELTANGGERRRKYCIRLFQKCKRKYDGDEKDDGGKGKDGEPKKEGDGKGKDGEPKKDEGKYGEPKKEGDGKKGGH